MKHLLAFVAPLAMSAVLGAASLRADQPDPGQIEISVGRLLEQGHYSRMKLDEKVSQRFLKYYL